jgi:hypothetical protein
MQKLFGHWLSSPITAQMQYKESRIIKPLEKGKHAVKLLKSDPFI